MGGIKFDPILGKTRKSDVSSEELDEIYRRIDGKAPSVHHHTVSQIEGLDSALGGKADKVASPTAGNFAGLDANGNPTDSGKKAADFAPADHNHAGVYQPVGNYATSDHNHDGVYQPAGSYAPASHSHAITDVTNLQTTLDGKAAKANGHTTGNLASLDAQGNPVDSGKKASDFAEAGHSHTDKADKVTGATNGNFAGLDSNGNLTDSGKKASDFAAASHSHNYQEPLVSGTNIKTVNGQSILGSGNIDIAQSVVENVVIKLTAPTAVDWTQLTVLVQNISAGTSTQLALSANGECSTNIPMGNLYEITLPSVGQYTDPLPVTYTAIGATRNIQHNYSYDAVGTELVKIQAHVAHPTATVASLSGLTAYATDTNSNVYSGTFNASGYCEISIPYGKSYTLTMPELQGLVHDHNADHHVSGVPARNVLIHYTEIPIGCFGIDANGKHYTAAEIAELPDKDIIVFVGYNDLQLTTMDRGDGTHGCGIMWKVTSEVASKSWANQNIEFDHNRLPYVASEAAATNAPCSGRLYTETILEILEDMQTDSQNQNPTLTAEAATYCASKTAQCGGVDLQGFMGNFFEYKWPFVTNKTLIQEVYTALGKTAPAVWSGNWWTSYQGSAQNAVILNNGSFFSNDYKTYSYSVLPLYDLIIKS